MSPTHAVRKNGKIIGYRWGKTGKLYTGPGAKAKADRQGRAIESRKHGG